MVNLSNLPMLANLDRVVGRKVGSACRNEGSGLDGAVQRGRSRTDNPNGTSQHGEPKDQARTRMTRAVTASASRTEACSESMQPSTSRRQVRVHSGLLYSGLAGASSILDLV
jgi:hypothetical protein